MHLEPRSETVVGSDCPPMFDPSVHLSTMMDAAHAAGQDLMHRFRRRGDLTVSTKGPADFVTSADLESEQRIRSILLGRFPDHGFLSEESEETAAGGSSRARFIVDPLDGTTNFLNGVPHFAISIALERGGQTVSAVVFDVPKNEMFVAEEGRGAWSDQHRLRVSGDTDLSGALVGTGIPHASGSSRRVDPDTYLAMLRGVMREAAGVRRFAAAALDLAYVASGRFAAFFEFGLSVWDVAAGILLVREAGGRVSEPDGGVDMHGSGNVLATNARLHARMIEILSARGVSP